MADGVRVEGARELRAALKRAGEDVGDLKAAHADAASIVATFAGASAPRRSGRLAGSIRASGTTSKAIVRVGKKSVPYASVIHWGWARRGIRANPFVSEAAQRTEPRWVDIYTTAVQRMLDRIRGN